MKRLMMFLAAGMLLIPVAGWAQQVADSFDYPVDNYQSTMCFGWGEYRGGSRHVAQDVQCTHVGAQVRAAGNGKVMLAEPHGSICDPDYNWGTILVIEHTLSDGSKVCTIYGHINYTVSEGANVTKGQSIGSVKDFSCPEGWTDHVHFGVYDGAFGESVGSYPSWLHGYLPPSSFPGDYLKPDDFVASHQEAAYHGSWAGNSSPTWAAPNQILTGLFVKFTNDGTDYWLDARNVTNPHDVELWNCDAIGNSASPWLIPVNWISTGGRIVGPSPSPTNPGVTGTFTFSAQVPNVASQDKLVWLRLFHQGDPMNDWPGVNITIRVDADPPSPEPAASVTPTTNNVNNFSFSWTPCTDSLSLLKGYYWSVNGGGETLTQLTSVPYGAWATRQGSNTFSVRAVDNVGNSMSAPDVAFTLTSSPCPGREIPNTCVPSTQCYPASAANLNSLPDMSAQQWQSIGQPVRDRLQIGKTYSIGFEYRSTATTDMKLGLGTFNPTSDLGVVVNASTLPASTDNEWRTFWSAPFTVTAEQLERFSSLKLLRASTTDGFDLRHVRIVAYQ